MDWFIPFCLLYIWYDPHETGDWKQLIIRECWSYLVKDHVPMLNQVLMSSICTQLTIIWTIKITINSRLWWKPLLSSTKNYSFDIILDSIRRLNTGQDKGIAIAWRLLHVHPPNFLWILLYQLETLWRRRKIILFILIILGVPIERPLK